MSTSSPPAPRELSFELNPTFAEHLRAQKAAQAHGRGRQIRTQQLTGAAIGLPLGVAILYGRDGRLDWTDWLLLVLVVGYFVSPLPNVLQVRRLGKQAGGPARITLSERGVTMADARGGSTLAWPLIRDVTERDGFLFFDTADDASGIFVPIMNSVCSPISWATSRKALRNACCGYQPSGRTPLIPCLASAFSASRA